MSNLDDAYANGPYIPKAESFPARWAQQAADFRNKLGELSQRRAYGPGPRHWFDLFLPATEVKGTLVFVHGGYWLKFDAQFWSHLARGALERGWAVAMPCYDLCPDVKIAEITQQIASAVETLAWQMDGPISLAGHSAGGHLVARMLDDGMLMADTRSRLVAVAPISPVADLRPLLKTSMNAQFQMTEHMAKAESPIFQARPDVPVSIRVGADERPAFLDQARGLQEAWDCALIIEKGLHHFDIIDALQDPQSDLVKFLTRET